MKLLKLLGIETKKENAKKSFIRLFFSGFAMGSADIVPGVSGGTVAFILGIYEELIHSIKLVTGQVIKLLVQGKFSEAFKMIPFKFLIPLGSGLLIAVVSMAPILENLLLNYPVYVWSFFFGLVVVSAWIVSKRVVNWHSHDITSLALGAVIAFGIVGLVPQETPKTLLAFFIAGAIAICAMILPGVSGSFLLIIMGKYTQLLSAVNNRELLFLAVFIFGTILGLATFSRILSWLFKNHHDIVVAGLTGFMIGSLRKIWPWKEVTITRINSHGLEVPVQEMNVLPQVLDGSVLLAFGLALTAVLLMLYVDKLQLTKEHVTDLDKDFAKEHKKALKKEE